MRVYQRREHPPLKWVLAGILFLLVMTLTVTEVNGFNHPPQRPDHHNPGLDHRSPKDHNNDMYDRYNRHDGDGRGDGDHGDGGNGGDCNPPTAVPEPTTMALLGIGLGGMVINRVRARKN